MMQDQVQTPDADTTPSTRSLDRHAVESIAATRPKILRTSD